MRFKSRAIAEKSRNIRLPIHITEKLNFIKKSSREFSRVHGRSPSLAELAETGEMSVAALQKLLALQIAPLSFDRPVGESVEDSFGDFLPSTALTPENYAEQQEVKQAIAASLAALTPREQDVLVCRFGLNRVEMRPTAIAAELGVSRTTISHCEKQAMQRLRENKAIAGLVKAV